MTDLKVDWVDSVPDRGFRSGTRISQFDAIAAEVRATKKTARVELEEALFKSIPSQLRTRYSDLDVISRTVVDDEGEVGSKRRFVYISVPTKGTK